MRSRASGVSCGDSVARLQRRDHVDAAAARDLDAARDVGARQLERRTRQRPHDRGRVARVDEQSQPGEDVADLGALEERLGADDAARHRALGERDRDHLPLLGERTDQHRAALGRDPVTARQALELGGDLLRLRALVLGAPEADLAAGAAAECLAIRGASGATTALGRVEHELRAAEALGQRHDVRVGALAHEALEPGGAGAARAADRLVVVAGDRQHAAARLERPHQLALAARAVLPVVDQDRRVLRGDALAQRRVGGQHRQAGGEHAALVVDAALLEHAVVGGEDGGELALARPRGPVDAAAQAA